MILSTVNFVNNYKFSDYIIDKITEEQSERDDEVRRKYKRHSLCMPSPVQDADVSHKKRTSLKSRLSGEFSKVKLASPTLTATSSSSEVSSATVDTSRLVTIETTDKYTLTPDSSSLHVTLKKNAKLSQHNVFRKIDFETDDTVQGRLTVFQLLSNPSYYLATSHLRHLELQSYCADTLDEDNPDERFFRCYNSEYGVSLLQPHAHKGFYIHHIDNFIDVRKLELNLRPPEEYYLHLNSVNPSDIPNTQSSLSSQSTISGSCTTSSDISEMTSLSTNSMRRAIPDISKSSLKRKDSKKIKDKTKEGPLKSGMLSCFGLSSKKKKEKSKH